MSHPRHLQGGYLLGAMLFLAPVPAAAQQAVELEPRAAESPAPPAAPATGATPANRTQKAAPANPKERVAVIAALDKRLGTTAEFKLKPGERFTFGRLSGIMRTCERTQPHERKQSGAFVQLVEQPIALGGKPKPPLKTVFSGWLFAESPSLNPFTHPVYDVWLKSCTMSFPEGPKPPASGRSPARKADAAKPSAETPAPAAPSVVAPTAPE